MCFVLVGIFANNAAPSPAVALSLKHPRASNWFRETAVSARQLDAEVVSWLSDPGSLTKRLRDRCADRFSVRVLGQEWVKPAIDEARLLQIPARQSVLLRQVQLLCGSQVLVYARSIIPLDTPLAGSASALKIPA